MIEEYDFGMLQVGGKEYRRDVIIYPEGDSDSERVNPSWWLVQGCLQQPLSAMLGRTPSPVNATAPTLPQSFASL